MLRGLFLILVLAAASHFSVASALAFASEVFWRIESASRTQIVFHDGVRERQESWARSDPGTISAFSKEEKVWLAGVFPRGTYRLLKQGEGIGLGWVYQWQDGEGLHRQYHLLARGPWGVEEAWSTRVLDYSPDSQQRRAVQFSFSGLGGAQGTVPELLVRVAARPVEGGYWLEAAIPFRYLEDLGIRPTGSLWGMAVKAVDVDEAEKPDQKSVLSTSKDFRWAETSSFNNLILE